MKALLIAIAALTIAVIAGHYVAEDPGFIVIGYGGKVIRTTFAFFALLLLVGGAALYVLLRVAGQLVRLRGRWRVWTSTHQRRKAHRALAEGLVAMGEGRYAAAEKTFLRAVAGDERPEAHYLAAAEAAQAQHAAGRRDNYLQLAHDLNPELAPALALRRARWAFDAGDAAAAERWLAEGQQQPPDPEALKLQFELRKQRHDAAGALALIPALRRDRALSHDEASRFERECASEALLDGSRDAAESRALWTSLEKAVQTDPGVVSAYARSLMRLGQHDEAEALLRKRLEKAWDSALAALYGELECEPPAKQLRKLEAWSVTRGDDSGLRLARARQSIRAGLWGQARTQVEALMQDTPSPLLHQLMAAVLEGMNDADAAQAERQAGLALATGEGAHQRDLPALENAGV